MNARQRTKTKIRVGKARRRGMMAPDGWEIRPMPLWPESPFMSIVTGVLGKRVRSSAPHCHYSLDQCTVLLEGHLRATMGEPGKTPATVELRPGEAIITPAIWTLSFETEDFAKVLFTCVPPYPQDDSNTNTRVDHLSDLSTRAGSQAADELRKRRAYIVHQY